MEDLVRLEVDAAAVAEAELDRGAPAGGLRRQDSNWPQAPRIWSICWDLALSFSP